MGASCWSVLADRRRSRSSRKSIVIRGELGHIHVCGSADEKHRDLHEGQILISACPVENNSTDYSSPLSTGIQTTIIDFGLSRLNAADGRVIHTEIHSEIFEGVGDQWDVYRSMRDIAKSDWNAYHPVTNVMVSDPSIHNNEQGLTCSGYITSCDTSCNPRNLSSHVYRKPRLESQAVRFAPAVYPLPGRRL